ncbi:hypothetical protein MLD38_003869 [Melastoma candidum]|uniref:Uncharacterized protein n=1 Tax=Melastoma candidum TaxID=119954 RepID=A0ACB9S731_9MYRT|nr:hypothetical protein MLD38_003869 [Melastoma candidum]
MAAPQTGPEGVLLLNPQAEVPWSTGLCGCFPGNLGRYFITCCCPCYTFGKISEIIDKGSSSCGVNGAIYLLLRGFGFACCHSMVYQMSMRKQYALEGSTVEDFIFHCCCEACALTQEYSELQNRGLDPSLGWSGNSWKQNRELVMVPVSEARMTR